MKKQKRVHREEHRLQDTGDMEAFVLDVLIPKLKYPVLILLKGNLGAGKTTLVQILAKFLGITRTVVSPTYFLVRNYEFAEGRELLHMDLYRCSDDGVPDDLLELIDANKDIVAVEWSQDKLKTLFSSEKQIVEVMIDMQPDGTRLVSVY